MGNLPLKVGGGLVFLFPLDQGSSGALHMPHTWRTFKVDKIEERQNNLVKKAPFTGNQVHIKHRFTCSLLWLTQVVLPQTTKTLHYISEKVKVIFFLLVQEILFLSFIETCPGSPQYSLWHNGQIQDQSLVERQPKDESSFINKRQPWLYYYISHPF